MVFKFFLVIYQLAWVALTPLVVLYLFRRGRRDPVYVQHLGERFGRYPVLPRNPVWIHAVSLGETRSAVPLARDLLAAGETVVFTHFTPAGRKEAARAFGPEMAEGRVASVWVPLDMFWVFNRFFTACRPKFGLTMEIEIWPAMVFASRRAGVPLYMCNAQYPGRSLKRDSGMLRLRQRIMTGFAGAFVKSQMHADRFAVVGLRNIHVTGELRFDQPIPQGLLNAAAQFLPNLVGRQVITFASAVEGEDALFLLAIKTLLMSETPPFIVYVPRAPEHFDAVARMFHDAGIDFARRSEVFGDGVAGLNGPADWPERVDLLLGDSIGEMYFYLSLADRVVVGAGFVPAGAHNIIEPLALNKPVITGPYTFTIEYPFVEAQAAGVALSVPNGEALVDALRGPSWTTPAQIEAFMAAHSGASARTLVALQAEVSRHLSSPQFGKGASGTFAAHR